jgi:hypothetical protein
MKAKGQAPVRVDELEQVHPERPTVFAVAPVRTRSRVPRLVVIAVAVGVVAFLAGVQVGAAGATGPSLPTPLPPSFAPAPSPAPSPAATPLPTFDPPGSSSFARAFRPAELVAGLADGAGCVTGSGQKVVPRTLQEGSRLTFVQHWMTFCPLEEERRQTFVLAVIDALVQQVPSQTYGHSTGAIGAASALFPYAEHPYVGTVALSADAAGMGYEIVITLEERLGQ